MMFQTVLVDSHCLRCGRTISVRYTQRCRDGRLSYSESIHCESCGASAEADGAELPDELRTHFISEGGLWELRLTELPKEKIPFLKILSDVLQRESKGILTLTKLLPAVLRRGTQVEIECVHDRLVPSGAGLAVVRISD